MNGSAEGRADALRRRVAGPFFNKLLGKWVGRGDLDYEIYLNTDSLLALQTPPEHLVVPEELMFQVVHQSQELWLKLLCYELVEVVGHLERGQSWQVVARLERCVRVLRTLEQEMRVLETLRPQDFLEIRRNLGAGSGQESPGYNALRVAAEGVWEAFQELLERRITTLLQAYASDGGHDDLGGIAELLVDLDEGFQSWLVRHYFLVRRTIGVDRRVDALDGLPTRVLAGRMTKPLFPELWDLRVAMTAQWDRRGGFAPGESRADGEGMLGAASRSTGDGAGEEP